MNSFEKLDSFLKNQPEQDGVYWGEEGVDQAQNLLDELAAEEFQLLFSIWRQRPKRWQMYLADSLVPGGNPVRNLSLLLTILNEGTDEVVPTATNSLLNFDINIVKSQIKQAAIDRVQSFINKNPEGLAEKRLKAFLMEIKAT